MGEGELWVNVRVDVHTHTHVNNHYFHTRYTIFIFIYPLGMLGEAATLFLSSKSLRTTSIPYLDRVGNYSLEYVIYVFVCMWPVLWFPLYTYMFGQRAAKLGGGVGIKRD